MTERRTVSPAQAARILNVHLNTVRSWCYKAIQGEPSKLQTVRKHPLTGYFSIDLEEIRALKKLSQP